MLMKIFGNRIGKTLRGTCESQVKIMKIKYRYVKRISGILRRERLRETDRQRERERERKREREGRKIDR